ncbi:alpha-amylase, partial [bacterium]|nr:alpha-amylase [bacterium]
MKWRSNPIVYEINTRIWLKDISNKYNTKMDLADVPDEVISDIKNLGFDAIWLMGVWEPSVTGREIAASHSGLISDFRNTLNDLKSEDIV